MINQLDADPIGNKAATLLANKSYDRIAIREATASKMSGPTCRRTPTTSRALPSPPDSIGTAASSRGAPLYGLVFAWALIAINAAGGQRFSSVSWAAIGGIVLVLAVTAWRLSDKNYRHHWFGVYARPTLT